jgi:hypothetical protein
MTRDEARALQLKVTATVSGGTLTVGYRIVNPHPLEILLTNRLFRSAPSGARTLDPELTYVTVCDSQLLVARTLVSVPPQAKVDSLEVPYLTRVPAGEAFAETFHLPLPVPEHMPYSFMRAGPSTPVEGTCQELVFSLSYLIAGAPDWVHSVKAGTETALAVDYGHAIKTVRTAVAQPIALACPYRLA